MPANVEEISVFDLNGNERIGTRQIQNGRVGYFDEKGYIFVYSGYKIIVRKTKAESDPLVQQKVKEEEENHTKMKDTFWQESSPHAFSTLPPEGAEGAPSGPHLHGKALQNDPEFREKLAQIAGRMGVSPADLIRIMYKESGMNPRAVNRTSRATGLIQFMDFTAISLGTTIGALYRMSAVEQLDYVEKYFKPHAGRLHNYQDLYLAVFYPLALSKPHDFVFGSEHGMGNAEGIASQNSGIRNHSNRPDKLIDRDAFNRYALS